MNFPKGLKIILTLLFSVFINFELKAPFGQPVGVQESAIASGRFPSLRESTASTVVRAAQALETDSVPGISASEQTQITPRKAQQLTTPRETLGSIGQEKPIGQTPKTEIELSAKRIQGADELVAGAGAVEQMHSTDREGARRVPTRGRLTPLPEETRQRAERLREELRVPVVPISATPAAQRPALPKTKAEYQDPTRLASDLDYRSREARFGVKPKEQLKNKFQLFYHHFMTDNKPFNKPQAGEAVEKEYLQLRNLLIAGVARKPEPYSSFQELEEALNLLKASAEKAEESVSEKIKESLKAEARSIGIQTYHLFYNLNKLLERLSDLLAIVGQDLEETKARCHREFKKSQNPSDSRRLDSLLKQCLTLEEKMFYYQRLYNATDLFIEISSIPVDSQNPLKRPTIKRTKGGGEFLQYYKKELSKDRRKYKPYVYTNVNKEFRKKVSKSRLKREEESIKEFPIYDFLKLLELEEDEDMLKELKNIGWHLVCTTVKRIFRLTFGLDTYKKHISLLFFKAQNTLKSHKRELKVLKRAARREFIRLWNSGKTTPSSRYLSSRIKACLDLEARIQGRSSRLKAIERFIKIRAQYNNNLRNENSEDPQIDHGTEDFDPQAANGGLSQEAWDTKEELSEPSLPDSKDARLEAAASKTELMEELGSSISGYQSNSTSWETLLTDQEKSSIAFDLLTQMGKKMVYRALSKNGELYTQDLLSIISMSFTRMIKQDSTDAEHPFENALCSMCILKTILEIARQIGFDENLEITQQSLMEKINNLEADWMSEGSQKPLIKQASLKDYKWLLKSYLLNLWDFKELGSKISKNSYNELLHIGELCLKLNKEELDEKVQRPLYREEASLPETLNVDPQRAEIYPIAKLEEFTSQEELPAKSEDASIETQSRLYTQTGSSRNLSESSIISQNSKEPEGSVYEGISSREVENDSMSSKTDSSSQTYDGDTSYIEPQANASWITQWVNQIYYGFSNGLRLLREFILGRTTSSRVSPV